MKYVKYIIINIFILLILYIVSLDELYIEIRLISWILFRIFEVTLIVLLAKAIEQYLENKHNR
jgi:hypothetical protein